MPKIEFSTAELEVYFKGNFESFTYAESVEFADALRTHADGIYPAKLIDDARPNEPDSAKEYRQKIWKPKTKSTFGKVVNHLSKIRRSADWSITFPGDAFPRIPDDESLQQYLEMNLPQFGSLTNWVFQILLREYLIDPNAVVLWTPYDAPDDVEETEFIRPYPIIFQSEFVIDFAADDYAVLENPQGAQYYKGTGTRKTLVDGKSFYIVTTESIFKYDQTGEKTFSLVEQHDHACEMLPADKIRATLIKVSGIDFLYESRIASMLTPLDEAAREHSDYQSSKIVHLYPERWEITGDDCATCAGSGKIPGENGPVVCDSCGGSGDTPNIFSKLLVRRPQAGEQGFPIPPAGFVEKDVEIIKLMRDSIESNLYDALASVNLEFLSNVPLAESGIAKEVDHDESNNFVHSVAEDLVRVMDWSARVIARMRYSAQYSHDDIELMLPTIAVPEHFDLFSTKMVEDEFNTSKDKKWHPVMQIALEKNLAAKKFATAEDDVLLILNLVLDLDPLAGISEDDKMIRLSNKGIALKDYIISSNIHQFVRRAMRADESFPDKSFDEQRAVLDTFADEIIQASAPAPAPVPPGQESEDDLITNPGEPAAA